MPSSLIRPPCRGRISASDLAAQAKLADCDFQDEIRTPEEHGAHAAQARYYAMIAQIDDQFARILQALEETGQRDNTVIIFTSDHGEALGITD